MMAELRLVITENKQIIKTLAKETNAQASHLVKSLQEFQQLVNAALTKIIEEHGGFGNQEDNEELGDDSEEDEDAVPVSPKKRRK